MKELQVMRGIRGTRQLVSCYADVLLRKRGHLPKLKDPIKYRSWRHKPWTDAEYDEAQAARLRGESDRQIAATLKRTIPAIQRMIGYGSKSRTGASA